METPGSWRASGNSSYGVLSVGMGHSADAESCAGEIHEYKEELRALDKGKRMETVKKVIAAMTIGKDVSIL